MFRGFMRLLLSVVSVEWRCSCPAFLSYSARSRQSICINLDGGLVPGEVELFLNLALAAAQVLVSLFILPDIV